MKQIEISDESFLVLKNLKEKILTQDNRATRNPLFSVLDYKIVICNDDNAEGYEIVFHDSEKEFEMWKPFVPEGCSNNCLKLVEDDKYSEELKEYLEETYELENVEIDLSNGIENFLEELKEEYSEFAEAANYEIYPVRLQKKQWNAFFLLEDEAFNYIETKKHDMFFPYTYAYCADAYTNSSIEQIRKLITELEI